MTAALKQAFTTASHLPRAAQEQLARQMLKDIEGELKWHRTLADSQALPERMAGHARAAKVRGRTIHKGFDEL